MSTNKNLIMFVILVIAGIAGYMASKAFYQENTESVDFQSLLLYPEQKNFSGFILIDKDKNKITNDSFKESWTLLFFGYTHCPDVCPTTLSELQKTFKILDKNNLKSMPNVLFVSVDSQRDTPDLLREYIHFFNQDFNAATADKGNILSIASQIGVAYHIGDPKEGQSNYDVDHTAAVFLINPEAKLFGIFRSPHDASKIAADLTSLIGTK
jgi:protein SCO1/2